MPEKKLEPEKMLAPLNITLDFDIADILPKEADEMCQYITDYLIKHYNVINWTYSIKGGE
jgi:hypothetical protein